MAGNKSDSIAGLDVLYIASHGFAVRMLIQTNLLGKLTASGLRVGLISTDKSDPTLEAYCTDKEVDLYEFNAQQPGFWEGEYQLLRRYLLEDIRNNPALWEKHLRFLNSEGATAKRKLKIKSYYSLHKISRILKFPGKIVSFLEQLFLQSGQATQLIRELTPRLVISTYPVSGIEASLLKAAKKEGANTAIHLLSWDNITCKGRFPETATEYLVWGPIMKEELQQYYGVPEKNIHETGVPHFDLHYRVKNEPFNETSITELGLNADKPYLFFAMSSPYFAPREIDIVEHLARWIQAAKWGDLQLVVRPHPQNVQGEMTDTDWLSRLEAIEGHGVAVDYPRLNKSKINWSMEIGDMFRLSRLITGCAVSLNSGSTVSIDALMHDKPVIITAFDGDDQLEWWRSAKRLIEFPHLKKLIAEGGVYVVSDYSEMQNAIRSYLLNSSLHSENRRKTINKEVMEADGNATERVVNVINKWNLT